MKRLLALLFLLPLLAFGEGSETVKVGTQTHNVLGPLTINFPGTTLDFTSATTIGLASGLTLQTDGTPNGSQTLLNLKAGTNITLTDNGSGQVTIDSTGGGGGGTWGSITGTLSDQLDLQSALDAKVDKTTTVNGHALSSNVTVTPSDLSLVIGTDVEAWDADLDTWATKTPYAGTLTITTGKTFNVTNILTLSGTDSSTLNIGSGGTLGSNAFTSTAYVPTSRSLTIGPTTSDLSADRTFLGSVTNDAQTKASIVPNTAPSGGEILVGNVGGTAYAKQAISGSGATFTLSSAGVLTISAIANASLSNPPSDTAFASSWNGVTDISPSKNAVYDWAHTFDTDDDGKVNVLDIGAGVVKTDSSGVVSVATADTDYTANAFKTLSISGQSDVVADSASDTLTFAAGTGITLTTNATTDTITVTNSGITSTEVSDTAFASGWNGVTGTAPSKNAVYDELHLFDSDDDGKVDVLDQGTGITNTNSSGVVQTALTAPSGTIVGTTDTQTLTNKRIPPRTHSTTSATSWTPDFDSYEEEIQTALAGAVTINAPTYTSANEGEIRVLRIKDNGTARAITWTTGSSGAFRASSDLSLPTTTTLSKTIYMVFIWNNTDSRFDLVDKLDNF